MPLTEKYISRLFSFSVIKPEGFLKRSYLAEFAQGKITQLVLVFSSNMKKSHTFGEAGHLHL